MAGRLLYHIFHTLKQCADESQALPPALLATWNAFIPIHTERFQGES